MTNMIARILSILAVSTVATVSLVTGGQFFSDDCCPGNSTKAVAATQPALASADAGSTNCPFAAASEGENAERKSGCGACPSTKAARAHAQLASADAKTCDKSKCDESKCDKAKGSCAKAQLTAGDAKAGCDKSKCDKAKSCDKAEGKTGCCAARRRPS
jgi:hypothetical protein